MDLKQTEEHIAALNKVIAEKNQKQAKLLKLQGLDDEILKREEELLTIDKDLVTEKEKLENLRTEKETGVRGVMEQIRARVDKLLPHGKCEITVTDEGQAIIGWTIDKIFVRYEGLSGAQKVMFDQAMAYTLLAGKTGILVYEAAEVDKDNLKLLLECLKGTGFQVIVNTWYTPPVKGFAKILKDWNVIKL
jgi:hypothetical protein